MHHRFVRGSVHRHVCQDVTDVTGVIAEGEGVYDSIHERWRL